MKCLIFTRSGLHQSERHVTIEEESIDFHRTALQLLSTDTDTLLKKIATAVDKKLDEGFDRSEYSRVQVIITKISDQFITCAYVTAGFQDALTVNTATQQPDPDIRVAHNVRNIIPTQKWQENHTRSILQRIVMDKKKSEDKEFDEFLTKSSHELYPPIGEPWPQISGLSKKSMDTQTCLEYLTAQEELSGEFLDYWKKITSFESPPAIAAREKFSALVSACYVRHQMILFAKLTVATAVYNAAIHYMRVFVVETDGNPKERQRKLDLFNGIFVQFFCVSSFSKIMRFSTACEPWFEKSSPETVASAVSALLARCARSWLGKTPGMLDFFYECLNQADSHFCSSFMRISHGQESIFFDEEKKCFTLDRETGKFSWSIPGFTRMTPPDLRDILDETACELFHTDCINRLISTATVAQSQEMQKLLAAIPVTPTDYIAGILNDARKRRPLPRADYAKKCFDLLDEAASLEIRQKDLAEYICHCTETAVQQVQRWTQTVSLTLEENLQSLSDMLSQLKCCHIGDIKSLTESNAEISALTEETGRRVLQLKERADTDAPSDLAAKINRANRLTEDMHDLQKIFSRKNPGLLTAQVKQRFHDSIQREERRKLEEKIEIENTERIKRENDVISRQEAFRLTQRITAEKAATAALNEVHMLFQNYLESLKLREPLLFSEITRREAGVFHENSPVPWIESPDHKVCLQDKIRATYILLDVTVIDPDNVIQQLGQLARLIQRPDIHRILSSHRNGHDPDPEGISLLQRIGRLIRRFFCHLSSLFRYPASREPLQRAERCIALAVH